MEDEIDRAYEKHGKDLWGRHEFYGIIKEEIDEVFDAIKKNESQEKLEKEIIQVAAMCMRYLETGDRYGWNNKYDKQGQKESSEGDQYIEMTAMKLKNLKRF